jgi:hypothetical protein
MRLPPDVCALAVNQLISDNLVRTGANVVNFTYPHHGVLGCKLFRRIDNMSPTSHSLWCQSYAKTPMITALRTPATSSG